MFSGLDKTYDINYYKKFQFKINQIEMVKILFST